MSFLYFFSLGVKKRKIFVSFYYSFSLSFFFVPIGGLSLCVTRTIFQNDKKAVRKQVETTSALDTKKKISNLDNFSDFIAIRSFSNFSDFRAKQARFEVHENELLFSVLRKWYVLCVEGTTRI